MPVRAKLENQINCKHSVIVNMFENVGPKKRQMLYD